MEKNKPEKIVVAYRIKKKSHKKGAITFFILAALVFIGVAVVCFLRDDTNLKILGGVLVALAVAYLLFTFVISNRARSIERVNQYSKIAILVYGQYLCIVRDKIEKIKLTDIKKVYKANDIVTGVFVRVKKESGTIEIKTKGKKYNVYQIANVDASQQAIEKYVNIAKGLKEDQ